MKMLALTPQFKFFYFCFLLFIPIIKLDANSEIVSQGQSIAKTQNPVNTNFSSLSSNDTRFHIMINLSCFDAKLRSITNALTAGKSILPILCLKNARSSQNDDFLRFQASTGFTTTQVSNGESVFYTDIHTPLSTASSTLQNELQYRVVNSWTNPNTGATCETSFGTFNHTGLRQNGSQGNLISMNITFPVANGVPCNAPSIH